MSSLLLRLISIADVPSADDDERLRRRVGVVAGYLTIFAPLPLTVQGEGSLLSWALVVGMVTITTGNLVVLARTHNFDRYVTVLLVSGVIFVPLATWVGGGITGTTPGTVFAFLGPAYAIMALGPERATRWFVVFLLSLALIVVVDPWAREAAGPRPYPLQLIGSMINAAVPLTIIFLLLRYTDTRRRVAEARADELLTNAIPPTIATRLRRGESRIAESYPDTTVLFADIAGFTPWTQVTDPDRVVSLLDDLFTRFDELAVAHGIEKIKTIGDSYMAVAGAPVARDDHAPAAVAFGEQMLVVVEEWRRSNDLSLGLRVGLASGSVVAGVIGQRRLQFDLWGATVNVAARMESSGVPGHLQIAESTWRLLPDQSGFVRREIEVKGLGLTPTYVLQRN